MSGPRLTDQEALAIVEANRQRNLEATKNFLIGTAKGATTDLPGFLMDIADKLAGDTVNLGDKDRSAQLFEAMTGIKTKSGSGGVEELVGSLINPIGAAKAVILPAVVAGKTAKQLEEAQRLLNSGIDVWSVFGKTGIYPGATDDILRSVISDVDAKIKPRDDLLSMDLTTEVPLSDVLDHPQLFALVPELENVKITGKLGVIGSGGYNRSLNKIFMGPMASETDFKSAILHETEHAIQNKFGMTRGGNPNMFFENRPAFESAKERLLNVQANLAAQTPKPTDSLKTVGDSLGILRRAELEAFRNYERISGEAEARAVETLLANPDLASTIPFDYYTYSRTGEYIPRNQLITDPADVPKVDVDPKIKVILDFIQRNPEFGKVRK